MLYTFWSCVSLVKKSEELFRMKIDIVKKFTDCLKRWGGRWELEMCREREIKEEGEEIGKGRRRKEVLC